MTDIAALVERLRDEIRDREGNPEFYDPNVTDMFKEVADALEACQAELDEARAAYDPVAFNATIEALEDAMDRAEKAEAERDDWRRIALERDQP